MVLMENCGWILQSLQYLLHQNATGHWRIGCCCWFGDGSVDTFEIRLRTCGCCCCYFHRVGCWLHCSCCWVVVMHYSLEPVHHRRPCGWWNCLSCSNYNSKFNQTLIIIFMILQILIIFVTICLQLIIMRLIYSVIVSRDRLVGKIKCFTDTWKAALHEIISDV